jgi:Putative peptidoglycan binding domain
MTGDRTKADPGSSKVPPGSATPNRPPPASDKADGRDDEVSKRSLADLARRLAERAAQQRPVDPSAAEAERRAALEAYDQARERRLIVGLSVAVAVTVGAGIAYLASTVDSVSTVDSRPMPPFASVAARPEPASSIERTSAAPAAASPDSPSPAASVAYTPAVEPASAPAALAADKPPAPVEATPSDAPLRRDEVREIQTRLRSLGFNPGPVDGTAGRMTEGAVRRYQQDRARPQTGEIDRQLLAELRQDPAAPVAQRAARPDVRAAHSPRPRRSDPFEPVRIAGDRFGQWLDSLTR